MTRERLDEPMAEVLDMAFTPVTALVTLAVGVLLLFRKVYGAMDWRISWRGPAVGAAVALAWLAPFSR